ncbi:MAG TPA: hypothetical protein VN708_04085 [Terriglobales bacterium]|jgi:ketosteroid isomerase-like protein|nr:hypothetical protein [Terriglobales bacterium]
MKKIFVAFALAVAPAILVMMAVAQQKSPAANTPTKSAMSAEKRAVMAVIKEFENDFNNGNPNWVQLCADQVSIIDEFPPFAWSGAGACSQWGKDYDADAQKNSVTHPSVWFGAAKHLDVAGDRAYVVLPASYNYQQNGKPVKETGATLTIALQKSANNWRIAAWTWSRG